MDIMHSVHDVPIRLPDERWRHILLGHPELEGQRAAVVRAVSDPEVVAAGQAGILLAVRRAGVQWIVVAYREIARDDGFVLTAYVTSREPTRGRRIVWTAPS
ncbi:MAG: hypothetical protein ACYDEB_03110 [Dehalococcoidia bacterium]